MQANEIDIDFGNLRITPFRSYSKISLEGFHYFPGNGNPMLPYKDTLIPVLSSEKGITYTVIDSTIFENITITPTQKAYPCKTNSVYKFIFDTTAYNSSKAVPDQIVKVVGYGKIRGRLYAKILMSPFKYYPSSEELIYYNKIHITAPNVNNYPGNDNIYPGIVVITDSLYSDSFVEYRKLKKIEGYSPIVRSTEFIYDNYSGTDNPDKIRNYIKTLKDSGIEYVLIAGDVEIVPTRYAFAMASGEGWWYDSIPTDYYYGDVDGSWNANNNTIYGEIEDSVDMLPDFYVGRISFNDIDQLQAILNKIYTYEKGEYLRNNCSVLASAGFLDSYTDASIGLDTILTSFPEYFKKSRLYDGNGSQVYLPEFMDSLNSGFNYLIHSNHGNSYGFSIGQDFFSYDNADTLTNVQKTPTLLYTTSCISASYDTDCMAEHYLRATSGGGYYIGDARFGWYIGYYSGESSTDLMQRLFFSNLFDGNEHTIGELVARNREVFAPSASTENTYRWMEYNLVLMGDPSTFLRTDSLRELNVSYDYFAGESEVILNISDYKGPVGNAVASVFLGDSLIARGRSDLSGHVVLSLQNPDTDDVIYVYKNNHFLFSDTFMFAYGIKYVRSFIEDGNDRCFNPGESDTLNMVIANQSDTTVYNPEFTFNSYDGFVNIGDSVIVLDSIGLNSVDTLKFIVDIGNVSDTTAVFYIKLNGNLLKDSIFFDVKTGKLTLKEDEFTISDFPSSIVVNIKNGGSGYFKSGFVHISSLEPNIYVTEDSVPINALYPDDSASFSIGIDTISTVFPNSLYGISVGEDTLYLLYSWNNFSETVDSLTPYGWEMYGIAHVSSKRYYSSPYSFRFGVGEDSLGYYVNDSLISPWIRSTGRMVLQYETWFDLQAGWDFALLFAGKDGDWSFLDSYSGASGNWLKKTYFFEKYPAGDSFKLKFVASTYNETGYEGWYIDNINVLPDNGVNGISIVKKKRKENIFKLINSISRTSIKCVIPNNFSQYDLKVINIIGREMFPKITTKSNNLIIDIREFRPGIYIVKYKNFTNKIIKI